ncbi:MAG: ABC transporter ATP-binding protein [Tannerellaceae bacterium]|jgi:putative ABC transport system ATP-binding protein|nr:ABC transporter ATP-binding protein [Tannerellaceae bacterium]
MIEIKNLTKVFYTKEIKTTALNAVNLDVERGTFLSIMGPSGCGKSTLLNMIGLLDQPTGGHIVINGTEVTAMRDAETAKFRNNVLGFIFQSFHLIPALNVLDNVELPLLYRSNVSEKECRKRALDVLEKVGLSHRLKHFPSQLSGGQCQRVAIARALIGKPEIILADEPTGNLDSKMSDEIMKLLVEINGEGTTIVMVTHDEKIAGQTQKIVRMLDGIISAV